MLRLQIKEIFHWKKIIYKTLNHKIGLYKQKIYLNFNKKGNDLFYDTHYKRIIKKI
jgi:hypothetical protein